MKYTKEYIQRLLVEKIAGTINSDEDELIDGLLDQDAVLRRQWKDMQMQIRQAEAKGFSVEADEETAWQQVQAAMTPGKKTRILTFPKMAVAAACILAIAGIYLLVRHQSPSSSTAAISHAAKKAGITLSLADGKTIDLSGAGNQTIQTGSAAIHTAAGSLSYTARETGMQEWSVLMVPPSLDYKIKLSDSTEVWLNAQTRLKFPFSFPGKTREVYIDGEAYFKVAKNPARPFIVHTPATDITVTGTQFNVNTYDAENVKTALVEGSVTTVNGNNQVHLKPGLEASYTPGGGFRVNAFDESEVLSWMKGVYYFHNTPLKDLARLLPRWFNTQVQFDKPVLQNKTFSGELTKNQSLQLFLDNLRTSDEIDVYFSNNIVHFR